MRGEIITTNRLEQAARDFRLVDVRYMDSFATTVLHGYNNEVDYPTRFFEHVHHTRDVPDVRAILHAGNRTSNGILDHFLNSTIEKLNRENDGLPLDELEALAGDIIAHTEVIHTLNDIMVILDMYRMFYKLENSAEGKTTYFNSPHLEVW